MKNFRIAAVSMLLLPLLATAAERIESNFARVVTDDTGRPQSLQLAIVSYVHEQGGNSRVDLVGAVHVGDASYYAELNERFEDYDALLYELIAPEGKVITRDSEKGGFLSGSQKLLTHALDLSFQLDEIDYTKPNFVHADLTPEQMSQSMADRDESLYSYFWQVIYASIREYGRDPLGLRELEIMTSALDSGDESPFKIMMAYEIADLDRFQGLFGNAAETAVIGARNQRAIDVLQRELDAGALSVGIFFGIGHMRDLEQRVLELGLVPIETIWVDAWKLNTRATATKE